MTSSCHRCTTASRCASPSFRRRLLSTMASPFKRWLYLLPLLFILGAANHCFLEEVFADSTSHSCPKEPQKHPHGTPCSAAAALQNVASPVLSASNTQDASAGLHHLSPLSGVSWTAPLYFNSSPRSRVYTGSPPARTSIVCLQAPNAPPHVA